MDLDRYHRYLARALTPARLAHSIGVMKVMGELAEVYGLDRDQALASGLLHDAAKDLTPDEQAASFAEAGLSIEYPCELNHVLYLHGPLSAYLVRKELGVEDTPILDAIYTHTWKTAPGFDAPLSWCLRFADLVEPNRDWSRVRWLKKGGPRVRVAAYGGRLAEAALLQAGILLRWFPDEGYPVHPNMECVYRQRLAELGLDDSYLEDLL